MPKLWGEPPPVSGPYGPPPERCMGCPDKVQSDADALRRVRELEPLAVLTPSKLESIAGWLDSLDSMLDRRVEELHATGHHGLAESIERGGGDRPRAEIQGELRSVIAALQAVIDCEENAT